MNGKNFLLFYYFIYFQLYWYNNNNNDDDDDDKGFVWKLFLLLYGLLYEKSIFFQILWLRI